MALKLFMDTTHIEASVNYATCNCLTVPPNRFRYPILVDPLFDLLELFVIARISSQKEIIAMSFLSSAGALHYALTNFMATTLLSHSSSRVATTAIPPSAIHAILL